MVDFVFKQGDTEPDLEATLSDADGIVNLSAATSIRFVMARIRSGIRKVEAPAALINDGTDGQVRYVWQSGDTDEWGIFKGEFVVTFPGGEATFPSQSYIIIAIVREV